MQSLISSYVADRDEAVADFNLIMSEGYTPSDNITKRLKKIMDRIAIANLGIQETQETWRRMVYVQQQPQENPNEEQKGTNEEIIGSTKQEDFN